MGPKAAGKGGEHDLFRMELVNLIGQRHELVRLAALIEWDAFSQQWRPQFTSTTGRPALPTRLMASLLYLKRVYALSDEDCRRALDGEPVLAALQRRAVLPARTVL